jgi:nucleotide-binding universal stress UspA family protein
MVEPRPGRIYVGITGDLANLAALHAAVALARQSQSRLVAIRAWLPVGGEIAYYRAPCPQLLDVWRQQAADELRGAFSDAFNGYPPDVDLECLAVRGEAGPVLVKAASEATDFLVVGAGRRDRLHSIRPASVSRYCLRWAQCPVVAVPQPEMIRELRRGLVFNAH